MSLQREFLPRNFRRRSVRRVRRRKKKKSPRFSERIYQLYRVPPLFTSRTHRQHVRNRTRITPEGLLRRGKASDIHPCAHTQTHTYTPLIVKGHVRARSPGFMAERTREFVLDDGEGYIKSLARRGTRSLPILTTVVVLCKLDVE